MTDREKLVELIRSIQDYGCKTVHEKNSVCAKILTAETVADFLIANGVTVQGWRDAKTDAPVTPEDFLAKVESIYGDVGDPEVFHDKTDTLMEDILIAFGYQKGINFLRSKVRWSA